ncbi:MBL fold metallo-hydrolase, partial [Desulfobulbus sp. TB]|nr:MBL fold metallo-hydrolase [Desulfobulbus sp. TB]
KLTQISKNVYAYVDTKNSTPQNSFGANAGIIIGEQGIAVIDTLVSANEAKRFIRDIRAISDKPIKYVINTHYHLDHVFGNAEFVKLGAVVIAQEKVQKSMQESAAETLKNVSAFGLTPEDIEGTEIAYPVIAYQEKVTIDLGGTLIELTHIPHSHTGGDTLVYLPEQKVLFTGDVLFTDYHPFLGEGDIEKWTAQLDAIKKMGAEKIIPGHGPVSNQSDLEDMKAYLTQFDKKAKELADHSDDVQEIVKALQSALPVRSEGAGLIPMNIQMKYLKKE